MPETTEPGCHGNARLAIAGDDAAVSIISMAEARVTTLLQGHVAAVTDLAANPSQPGALAALSSDGSVALWDLGSERQRGPCSTSHAASLVRTGSWCQVLRDGLCSLCGLGLSCVGRQEWPLQGQFCWPCPAQGNIMTARLPCLHLSGRHGAQMGSAS